MLICVDDGGGGGDDGDDGDGDDTVMIKNRGP